MTERLYRLTRPGAHHRRKEPTGETDKAGRPIMKFRTYRTGDTIRMTERAAASREYSHLGLQPAVLLTGVERPRQDPERAPPPVDETTSDATDDTSTENEAADPTTTEGLAALIAEGEPLGGGAFAAWRQRVIDTGILEDVPAKKVELIEALRAKLAAE